MRGFAIRAAAAAFLATTGCGELPPIAPLEQDIAEIRFGSLVCGGELSGAVPQGGTCSITVEATDVSGLGVVNPSLSWISDKPSVLAASGSGATGSLTGLATGTAKLTVREVGGSAQASKQISVVAPR